MLGVHRVVLRFVIDMQPSGCTYCAGHVESRISD